MFASAIITMATVYTTTPIQQPPIQPSQIEQRPRQEQQCRQHVYRDTEQDNNKWELQYRKPLSKPPEDPPEQSTNPTNTFIQSNDETSAVCRQNEITALLVE